MKEKVRRGYANGSYSSTYRVGTKLNQFETEMFEQFTASLPVGAQILDLGSGPGIPYDRYLVGVGFQVTGLDFCERHIEEARQNVPEAVYLLCDFSQYAFPRNSAHAFLALYSLFHLPREQHAALLEKIASSLKQNGKLLITMGTENEPYKERESFCGAEMAWSYFDSETNLRLLHDNGFRVIMSRNEKDFGSSEKHLWVLAEKI